MFIGILNYSTWFSNILLILKRIYINEKTPCFLAEALGVFWGLRFLDMENPGDGVDQQENPKDPQRQPRGGAVLAEEGNGQASDSDIDK
jgi:hypothetical protein